MKPLKYSDIYDLGEYSTFTGSRFELKVVFPVIIPANSTIQFKLYKFYNPLGGETLTPKKEMDDSLNNGQKYYTFILDEYVDSIPSSSTKGLLGKYTFQIKVILNSKSLYMAQGVLLVLPTILYNNLYFGS